MTENITISTIIIFTDDRHRLAAFYQKGLQLDAPQPNGSNHLGWQLANTYFGFDEINIGQQHPGGTTPWFEVDDLEAAYQRFLEAGAASRYGPTQKPWGAYLASLLDLDGNLFGLSQRQAL